MWVCDCACVWRWNSRGGRNYSEFFCTVLRLQHIAKHTRARTFHILNSQSKQDPVHNLNVFVILWQSVSVLSSSRARACSTHKNTLVPGGNSMKIKQSKALATALALVSRRLICWLLPLLLLLLLLLRLLLFWACIRRFTCSRCTHLLFTFVPPLHWIFCESE